MHSTARTIYTHTACGTTLVDLTRADRAVVEPQVGFYGLDDYLRCPACELAVAIGVEALCWCGAPATLVNGATDASDRHAACDEHVKDGYGRLTIALVAPADEPHEPSEVDVALDELRKLAHAPGALAPRTISADDVDAADTYMRVTGSVGCTYNGVSVARLICGHTSAPSLDGVPRGSICAPCGGVYMPARKAGGGVVEQTPEPVRAVDPLAAAVAAAATAVVEAQRASAVVDDAPLVNVGSPAWLRQVHVAADAWQAAGRAALAVTSARIDAINAR